MSQLTIQLDAETQRKVELAARRESMSLSNWALEHLSKAADLGVNSAWERLSEFKNSADEDFQLPSRETVDREIPKLS